MSRGLKWSGLSVGTQLAYWHWQIGRQQLSIPHESDPASVYRNSLVRNPLDPDLHFRLGFVLHQTGDRVSAHRYYERSLALRPGNGLVLEHLGRLYFEERSFNKAIPVLRQAIQAGPVQPMTLALVGRAYFEVRDFQTALESYRHLLSIDLNPEVEGVIRHQMILTLCSMGNLGAARRAALTLIQTHRMDQDLMMQMSDAFLEVNALNPAKEILGHIIRQCEEYLPARQNFLKILALENQIESLLPGIYSKEEEYALRYVSQLMRFGHEKVAKALLSLRGSESPLIRQCVVEYCCRFGYLSWGEITDFLKDPSALVRCKAAEYLTRFGPPNMAYAMAEVLQDESDVVRACSARFLKQHGTTEMVEPLKRAMEREQDAGTRLKIRAALTAIQRRSTSKSLSESLKKSERHRYAIVDQVSVWAFCSTLAGLIMLAGWLFFRY